jgi:hypothetical protein
VRAAWVAGGQRRFGPGIGCGNADSAGQYGGKFCEHCSGQRPSSSSSSFVLVPVVVLLLDWFILVLPFEDENDDEDEDDEKARRFP